MGLSSDNLQQLMMVSGLGMICWLLMRSRIQRRNKSSLPVTTELRHNANAQVPSAPFSGTQSLGAPSEVLRWQVELHELGRELKAELDSKLIAVRSMTAAYDQAARRLSATIQLAERMQLPCASPLTEARRLADLGWETSKIAQSVGLSDADVEHLLGARE